MLIRRYRIILIVKSLLFLLWWVLFLLQPSRQYTWGTLWIVDDVSSQVIMLQWDFSSLPKPRALVQKTGSNILLHIPWTTDTGYLLQYVQQPLSASSPPMPIDAYSDSCHTRISVSETSTSVHRCHWRSAPSFRYPLGFILLAFIL